MFEEIFFPRTAEVYRAAPLAEPRARHLRHLKELGTSRSTLRKCANDQLNLVRRLNLREADRISIHRIEAAATIWSRPKGRRCNRAASAKALKRFISRGIDWLRFLGWLDEAEEDRHPHHAEVRITPAGPSISSGCRNADASSSRPPLTARSSPNTARPSTRA